MGEVDGACVEGDAAIEGRENGGKEDLLGKNPEYKKDRSLTGQLLFV